MAFSLGYFDEGLAAGMLGGGVGALLEQGSDSFGLASVYHAG